MTFQRLCRLVEYADVTIEDVTDPRADIAQEAWLRTLTYLRNKGETLPNAGTSKELHDAYENHAGLVVVKSKQVAVDETRKRKGTKDYPKKTDLLSKIEGIDETYEDTTAESAFRHIEEREALRSLYNSSPPNVQAALRRFAYAFHLSENGQAIPGSLKTALSRDRKTTGLPLELRRRK